MDSMMERSAGARLRYAVTDRCRSVSAVCSRLLPRSVKRFLRIAASPYVLPRRYRDRLALYEKAETGRLSVDLDSELALLRMHCHIVDKGLNRDDWVPGHGQVSYRIAKELLDRYALVDDPSVSWANRVVAEYERRITGGWGGESCMGEAVESPPVGPDHLLRQMRFRLSSRSYAEKRVAPASAERIVEAALEAPWSCSRQALRVYASVEPDAVSEMASCFRGCTGFSAFIPAMMIFCVDLRPYSMPAELFVPHLDVGLACAYAALMASSMGLSMVYLSWGSRRPADEERLRTMLGVPDHYEIVVGAACGYPRRNPVKPARKAVESTLVWR